MLCCKKVAKERMTIPYHLSKSKFFIMTIGEVKRFFFDKESIDCPITEMLVKAGYQQRDNGYIKIAKERGILVDYTQNLPSQYWHLMNYCNNSDPNKSFTKSIVCGELIFWMAEVSHAVDANDLMNLAKQIMNSVKYKNDKTPVFNRVKWNKEIQILCFDRIQNLVEQR